MLNTSNRWFPILVLLMSGALWLAVSSVFANATHILAKSNFIFVGFGSVSIWLLAASFVWLVIVTYALSVNTEISPWNVAIGFGQVSAWVLILATLTTAGDELLGKLGGVAVIIWLIEVAVARFILSRASELSLPFTGILNDLWPFAVTLTWIMGIKILLLCLSPGVTIRI